MPIEVMLVDDHPIVRSGIKSVISQENDIKVIAEASDGKEAVEMARMKNPDIIIMDITLPSLNGLDASIRIIKQNKHAKILVLSMHENRALIEKALNHSIKGYVLKESASDDIIRAIRTIMKGDYFLSPKISSYVVDDFIARKKKDVRIKSSSILTVREREILQLIAEGKKSKEIAQKLKISVKTVLTHKNNIMNKLNVKSQAELIRYAVSEKLIDI